MSTTTEAQFHQIYERWHQAISTRNVDALMDLYADDAVLESSAILVIEKDPSGTLKGKEALHKHFASFFALMEAEKGDAEWHRPYAYHVHGNTIAWEYPSKAPRNEQLDVVESIDVENGKVAYQRVYWGFVGFKLLTELAERTAV
jgi:steroid delta-isomerase